MHVFGRAGFGVGVDWVFGLGLAWIWTGFLDWVWTGVLAWVWPGFGLDFWPEFGLGLDLVFDPNLARAFGLGLVWDFGLGFWTGFGLDPSSKPTTVSSSNGLGQTSQNERFCLAQSCWDRSGKETVLAILNSSAEKVLTTRFISVYN